MRMTLVQKDVINTTPQSSTEDGRDVVANRNVIRSEVFIGPELHGQSVVSVRSEFRIAYFYLLCFDVLSQSHSWESVDISVDRYTLDAMYHHTHSTVTMLLPAGMTLAKRTQATRLHALDEPRNRPSSLTR
jgi:hypothetical protein